MFDQKTSRRRFLKRLSIGTAALATGSYLYLDNEKMEPAPILPGKVLCDLHAHPSKDYPLDKIMAMIGSPGLVGLAQKRWTKNERDILTYEHAIDILPSSEVIEIEKGKVARFRQGYFARTQEVLAGRHHLLALGWEGDYFPSYQTIDQAVHDIHDHNGLVILNHPFAITGKRTLRLPQSHHEEDLIVRAYSLVDEVETHNAFCINIFPYFFNFHEMNERAEALREEEYPHFRGTASSDCHHYLEQVKIAGIYLDQTIIETQGMTGIKEAVKSHHFIRLGNAKDGPYVSRYNLLKVVMRGIRT